MTRLPVWATVTEAYRTVWMHRWLLLRFAAIPFLLVLAVDLASTSLYDALPPVNEADEWPWRNVAVDKAVLLLCALIAVVFVVPCYRLLLLGPATMKGNESWPAGRVYLGMAALSLVLTVLLEVPITLDDFMLESLGGRIWPVFGLSYIAVFLLLVVRLAFLYPAICLGERWQLSRRWRQTAGNLWRLSAAFLLAFSPLLFAMVLWAASFLFWWDETSDTLSAISPLGAFLAIFLLFAGEALSAAVTSVAFAVLTGYPAKGLRVPIGPA